MGVLEEKKSCLYQESNQETWFSSPLPGYNTDRAVADTRWVSAWVYNFYVTQWRLSLQSSTLYSVGKKGCIFWKRGGNLNWLQIIKGLKISGFWVYDGTRNVQRPFIRKPSTMNSVSMGKITDRNVATNTVLHPLQGIGIQWISSQTFSLLVHFFRILAIGLEKKNIKSKTWTFRAADQKYLESFEMWCWRRMEKISWTDHVRNKEVLLRVNEQRNILHEIRKR